MKFFLHPRMMVVGFIFSQGMESLFIYMGPFAIKINMKAKDREPVENAWVLKRSSGE